MKLKYYLRGLGIGMLVAALVLILSGNTGGRMSDEAVKRRAAELGMVEKDKTVLGDIGGGEAAGEDAESKTPEAGTDSAGTEEIEPAGEAASENNMMEQAGEAGTEEDAAEQEKEQDADAGEQALAQEIEQRAEEVADRAEEVAENSVPENMITLDIRSGDSSDSVARQAAEAGLVQSAADFDVFLCQNGYDKRISIGSYEIAVGASEKEIAEIITKSR